MTAMIKQPEDPERGVTGLKRPAGNYDKHTQDEPAVLGPVERPVRRVRINVGEPIFQDHGVCRWPMTASGPNNPGLVFDAEWNGSYWDCRADGHGRRSWLNEPGGYGNGSILVSNFEGVTALDDAPNVCQ